MKKTLKLAKKNLKAAIEEELEGEEETLDFR